jgi:hypothetical protein
MIGVIHDLQGETEAGIAQFSIAAGYDDNYAIYLRLGADYARLGKLPEAIEQMARVLGTEGQPALSRFCKGSLVDAILKHSHVPQFWFS